MSGGVPDAVAQSVLFPHGTEPWMTLEGPRPDMAARRLDGDEWLVIRPQLFSLRLAVMTAESASIEHWCFTTVSDALLAWMSYPTIPETWSRHITRTGEHLTL